MNNYIIIDADKLRLRTEELETKRNSEHKKGHDKSALRYENTILELKQLLSQSTPLIPEIEKHSIEFTKTLLNCTVSEAKSINNIKEYHPKEYQLLLGELELNGKEIFKDYISNLKLDI